MTTTRIRLFIMELLTMPTLTRTLSGSAPGGPPPAPPVAPMALDDIAKGLDDIGRRLDAQVLVAAAESAHAARPTERTPSKKGLVVEASRTRV